MKKLCSIFLFVAFVLSFIVPAYSADITNGLNDAYIGATTPAVTGKIVDAHIRVLEFVLISRMTVAQKQNFVKAVTNELKTMDTDQLNDFIGVLDLVDSLNKLTSKDAEPVRQLLEKDFYYTAKALEKEKDLAAVQYLKIRENLGKRVVSYGDTYITRQSIEALSEYLAFVANTKNPVWPNDLTTNATAMRVRTNFAKYTEDERSALEDFQLTWYLIRAAWQTATPAQKATWQKKFDKLGLKPGADVTSANIKAAINHEVYADMLDFATKSGIEALEWSPKTTAQVW